MTVALKKWGNSFAIRIPKDIANSLSVEYNSLMELILVDGALVLKPKKKKKLDSLVSKIDKDNLHKEISAGKSVGNEEW